MRRQFLLILALIVSLSAVFALDVNVIDLNVPSAATGDFNVQWEVNSAGDWNYFIVEYRFVPVVQSDGWLVKAFPTGVDYNSARIGLDDANYCVAESNDIVHCSLEFNWASVLRNGDVNVVVVGYDSNNDEINYALSTVFLHRYADINASASAFSPAGELNVLVSFDCNVGDVNTLPSGFVLHTPLGTVLPGSVDVNGPRVVLEFDSNVADLVRGTLLELNTADINADCNFAPDTNTLVLGLPDSYKFVPGKTWTPLVFNRVVDQNYAYTQAALSDLNVVLYLNDGNAWVTVSDPLADPSYSLRAYLVWSSTPEYIPLRYDSNEPTFCTSVNHIVLPSGWSLIPVYCMNGQQTCSDVNSTLYNLSFFELNSASQSSVLRPFYAYFAEWNGAGFVQTPSFGVVTVESGEPYWVWINPNWVQGGLTVSYYGRCISPPSAP